MLTDEGEGEGWVTVWLDRQCHVWCHSLTNGAQEKEPISRAREVRSSVSDTLSLRSLRGDVQEEVGWIYVCTSGESSVPQDKCLGCAS